MNRAFHRISILLVILILPASLAAQAAHKPADTTHQPAAAAPSGEKVWSDLMAGNRRYVQGKPKPIAVVQHTRSQRASTRKLSFSLVLTAASRLNYSSTKRSAISLS